MGTLINQERRKRARAARRGRMEQIIEAAAHLFSRQPFAEVTLDAIGQKAEVPHGTPSLYFGSREAVFLAAVAREVREWSDAACEALTASSRPLPDADVAALLAESVANRAVLARLVSLLPVAVEHLPEQTAMTTLTASVEDPLATLAACIERQSLSMAPGDGERLLYALFMGVIGAEALATPRSGLALAFHDPRLSRWQVDLKERLSGIVADELRRLRA